MNFKNLGELWTTIKIREKLQLNEQISHPILFAVELTQSVQICAEYLAKFQFSDSMSYRCILNFYSSNCPQNVVKIKGMSFLT